MPDGEGNTGRAGSTGREGNTGRAGRESNTGREGRAGGADIENVGDEDIRRAWGAHPRLEPGCVVAHFKRGTLPAEELAAGSARYLYRYLGVARHSETGEPLALYEALYPPFGLWARPLAMFAGEVDRAKYPGVGQRWRFEAIRP